MTTNEILAMLKNLPGAAMVRVSNHNYIAVPTETGYTKVSVTDALMQDRENSHAFNFEAGVAAYQEWEANKAAREVERANKPKIPRGPNPEAQARRDALDAQMMALPSFSKKTATEIFGMLGATDEKTTVMSVGSSALRLVEQGIMTVELVDKKRYYSKA